MQSVAESEEGRHAATVQDLLGVQMTDCWQEHAQRAAPLGWARLVQNFGLAIASATLWLVDRRCCAFHLEMRLSEKYSEVVAKR